MKYIVHCMVEYWLSKWHSISVSWFQCKVVCKILRITDFYFILQLCSCILKLLTCSHRFQIVVEHLKTVITWILCPRAFLCSVSVKYLTVWKLVLFSYCKNSVWKNYKLWKFVFEIIETGQNENYLFCGNVYRYKYLAAFKDLVFWQGLSILKAIGIRLAMSFVCFLYWHIRFKGYGIQIILCFCFLGCIENWVSHCPLIIKLFLLLWVLYCLNIAGNGIYGCSQGIHFDQWQCNGDRLF